MNTKRKSATKQRNETWNDKYLTIICGFQVFVTLIFHFVLHFVKLFVRFVIWRCWLASRFRGVSILLYVHGLPMQSSLPLLFSLTFGRRALTYVVHWVACMLTECHCKDTTLK